MSLRACTYCGEPVEDAEQHQGFQQPDTLRLRFPLGDRIREPHSAALRLLREGIERSGSSRNDPARRRRVRLARLETAKTAQ